MIAPCDGTNFREVRVNATLAMALRRRGNPRRDEFTETLIALRALEANLLREELRKLED